MSKLQNVDNDNFQKEVLESEIPVLVDFSAEWCGPCKKQTPILELFAEQNSKTVKVVKLDIDESSELSAQYNIRSVPSLVLFQKGKKSFVKVGLTKLSDLNDLLKMSETQFDLMK